MYTGYLLPGLLSLSYSPSLPSLPSPPLFTLVQLSVEAFAFWDEKSLGLLTAPDILRTVVRIIEDREKMSRTLIDTKANTASLEQLVVGFVGVHMLCHLRVRRVGALGERLHDGHRVCVRFR